MTKRICCWSGFYAERLYGTRPIDNLINSEKDKNGNTVFSMDIFGSGSNRSVKVIVDALNGKTLGIYQDRDDNTDNYAMMEDADEFKEQ